eukprot:CAMPEP_0118654496 /NCGR_PEP_ID=MMETSP0785-20121206/12427_1 /TAXON_ID=91992 /ORGANISM="Bolidomonas pacifica, Strain CCMP 1866" /LENGTH=207 /DNA_ID=CAMNT_0006547173 /DNA_START=173 /DNA_END=794 /DNA_ORIENTATION=+
MRTLSRTPSVIISGGGAIGLSLPSTSSPPSLPPSSITILDPGHPNHTRNSAVLSAGGVRTAFTIEENVRAGKEGLEWFRDGGWERQIQSVHSSIGNPTSQSIVSEITPSPTSPSSILQFQPGGYMFLTSTKEGLSSLHKTSKIRQSHNLAPSLILPPDKLSSQYPYLNTSDLLGASITAGDGWFDPWTYITQTSKFLQSLGVTIIPS